MTIFGPDISSYQNGLDLSKLVDAAFVIAKTTEGTYYTDACYQAWRAQAKAQRIPLVWYHFLSGEDARAQAAHTLANVGDASLPGMLDMEPEGNFAPTVAQALAYVDAAHAAGLNLKLLYLPRWYWARIGSPDLTPFAQRGLGLVSSSYPAKSGTAEQIYPGDWWAAGWAPYGGVTPLLYQFTNEAADGGQLLDMNAYKGTAAELAAFLNPTTGGSTVPAIPPNIGQKWPEIAGEFTGSYDDSTAIIWADGGARAAALFAQQARDAVIALAAKLSAPPPAPAVDVDALAAALAPKLAAGATADEVAHAVVMHLGADLAAG